MSLSLSQVSQVSPQFRQQLEAYHKDLSSTDAIIDSLNLTYKTWNLKTFSNQVQDELPSKLERLKVLNYLVSQEVTSIHEDLAFTEQQTVSASRLSENLKSQSVFLGKVTTIPSPMTDHVLNHLHDKVGIKEKQCSAVQAIVAKLKQREMKDVEKELKGLLLADEGGSNYNLELWRKI
jgi:hypothetical protein